MTALDARPVPGSREAAPEVLRWLSPAPLWTNDAVATGGTGLTQPWIAELTDDKFIPEFLGILSGAPGSSPDQLGATVPAKTVDGVTGGPYRLFQPLSQRYYLVTASLVCHRPGIPDHVVHPAKAETTTFVMRLLAADGTESAWVPLVGAAARAALEPGASPTGTWQPAQADALVAGEEHLPLHAAPVASFAPPDSTAGILGMAQGTPSTRTVHYGYVPVGRRERMIPSLLDTDVLARLADWNKTAPRPVDPIADGFVQRVVAPWSALLKLPSDPPSHYGSLFLILDLADWLHMYVPGLYAAICNNTTMPSGSSREKLQDQLGQIAVVTAAPSGTVALTTAIAELQAYAPLVTGADIAGPSTSYDLYATLLPATSNFPSPPTDWVDSLTDGLSLYQLAIACRAEEADGLALSVPPELSGLIKDDPVYLPPGSPQATYVIRTVFSHPPCRDVLSAPSHPFVLARAVDGDAPARKIRIQLPDLAHLRASQRGIALEMPPSLNALVNKITPDILKGTPLATGGVGLGMICSFSIQIIFLCAFIVLFVFLLLLNIAFWWMAFLKICFPIPVRKSSSPAPSP